MSKPFTWQEAIHDPLFWAVRYGCDGRYRHFPGVEGDAYRSYIEAYDFLNLAILEEDPLAGYVGEGDDPQLAEVEVGYHRLAIPFPESYVWLMDFAAEDDEDMTGIYHAIFHSEMDPAGALHPTSTGLPLADESGHARLPGLRWAELKQIQRCLETSWPGDFDVRAVLPLLYPVVEVIALDELEEVRRMLITAWQDLGVLSAIQASTWLDQLLMVYERGWWLRLDDRKEW